MDINPYMMWTVNMQGGPRRVNHAAAAVGNVIFSFGGYCTGDNYKDSSIPIDVFALHTKCFRWVEIPKPDSNDPEHSQWPYQRYGHTVAAYNGNIYLYGGRNDNRPCNILFCFNCQTQKWSQPEVKGTVPPERDGHSACIIGDLMIIFGGYEEAISRFGADLYQLNLKTMTWSILQTHGIPPHLRDFHTATAIGHKMVIFGGRSANANGHLLNHLSGSENYYNSVYYLDTTSMTWVSPQVEEAGVACPDGRRSHSALNWNGKLLIFGGYNSVLNRHYNDLWLLNPESWNWALLRPKGQGPESRRRQAMCLVNERVFLFGGTSPYDGPPILFTPDQQQFMPPEQEFGPNTQLIDHDDLHVLDLNPTLRTLCMLRVLQYGLSLEFIPKVMKHEMENMRKRNQISAPLKFG